MLGISASTLSRDPRSCAEHKERAAATREVRIVVDAIPVPRLPQLSVGPDALPGRLVRTEGRSLGRVAGRVAVRRAEAASADVRSNLGEVGEIGFGAVSVLHVDPEQN